MSAGNVLKGIRFPGRYIQGPGALERLDREIEGFAPHALILLDAGVYDRFAPELRSHLAKGRATLVRFAGECSLDAIAEAGAQAREVSAGVIVGMGGGKALDTAKSVADDLSLPVMIVPTIAASDAPCSALSVVYNPDGSVSHDRFLPRNPDLVLVDTAIIAKAPPRFLAAGIADALATWYEAASCERSGANNCLGLPGISLAYTIAATCRETIMTCGVEALADCARGEVSPALESIVEANILLSGLGFESGGVATAHAVHHGLSQLDEVHHYLHGEKVAIGILTGLLMQGDMDEYDRVRTFMLRAGLPTHLAEIGIADVTPEKLSIIAERACRPGEIIYNEPGPVTREMVIRALEQLV
ncbi:glycerol dehydrogenase [Martelella mediterranea]|uniref:glycerol dehydrogenase n=1 Tax=Martelella mediterranea TaxID=293089 RepID=UPI001E58E1ED|nr:glycerol dehydrogenase [Martelella mediterranea]